MVRAGDVARTDGGQDVDSGRQRRSGEHAARDGGSGRNQQPAGGGQAQRGGGGAGGHGQVDGGQQAAAGGGHNQRSGGTQRAAGHQGGQAQRGGGRGGGGGGGGHARGGAYGGGGDLDLVRWVKLGTSTYLLFGLGTAFTLFLFTMLAPGNGSSLGSLGGSSPFGSMGNTSSLFGFVALGWILMLFLVAGLSTALGLFVGREVDAGESAPLAGATTNAAGALIGTIVMLVLILILAPGGPGGASGALGQLIAPLLGLTAGAGVTGAAAAEIGHRSATW